MNWDVILSESMNLCTPLTGSVPINYSFVSGLDSWESSFSLLFCKTIFKRSTNKLKNHSIWKIILKKPYLPNDVTLCREISSRIEVMFSELLPCHVSVHQPIKRIRPLESVTPQKSGLSMLMVQEITKLNLSALPVWLVCLVVCFMTGNRGRSLNPRMDQIFHL